jgi:CheY-like chemotaxis protein
MMFFVMKILVVDDNKQTTSMLSKFFNYEGHSTVVTNDPMEGLTRIKQEKYDVILLDILMPVISGLNIIQILAAGGKLKNKNIFIFSGADCHESQIKDLLRRDGINGFLKKPIELDELLTTITC